jgi:hypothetical protein
MKNHAIMMINKESGVDTVKENCEGYSQREYEEGKQARRALGMVRYPSPKDFDNMVCSNMVHNCPIASSNIKVANNIFGPDIATLKVKTVCNTPMPVLTEYVDIQKEIIELNKYVTLAVDIMFVNKLDFMISAARKLKFTTSAYLPRRTKPMLVKSLKNMFNIILHTSRGFKVSTTLMDGQFECLRDQIAGVRLNTTASDEHIPDIKRKIRSKSECELSEALSHSKSYQTE